MGSTISMKGAGRLAMRVAIVAATAGAMGAVGVNDAYAAVHKKPKASDAGANAKAETNANAQGSSLTPGVIARVNGVPITQDRLDDAVRLSRAPDTPELRATLKNQLIARELFRQAAEKAHYESRPAVQAQIDQAKAMVVTQAWLQDQLKPVQVSDADVKAQYDKVVATLGDTEYKPSVIATRDADTAQKVLDQLRKGVDFAQLARQFSQGPNAAQGGEQGWISFRTPIEAGKTQNWPQPLAEALVKLPQGGVTSAPVQIDGTYWIVRADQKRATQIPTFDQSKDMLRKQLEQAAQTKAAAELVLGLTKQAHIEQ
ncbi:peptidylprolyl isomerase [Paraburkholderia silvatlantica]|uniref:peptidylprolyl isomerase n=1 Tax=Paraburkholderia silvatlantica TaxID=321895 RepID=UPI0010E0FF33|nr:peptidyl-prolyl cis-trans isomerase [Paraburkholderia silvatlantica]TDQ86205.1 parvulin-like peptidyl-prolyl isomerase [Paraburkholderia silvatlantica]